MADSATASSTKHSAWWARDKVKTPTEPTKAIKSEPLNVRIKDDTKNCLVTGFCIARDGNIVIADRNNYKIKVFSQDGKYISFLRLPEKPTDVVAINEYEIAVSMWSQQIGIVDVSDIHTLSLKNIFNLDYNVWAITSYKEKLIVTCGTSPPSVKMFDTQDNVLWSTSTSSDGTVLFDSPYFITTFPKGDNHQIIISDGDRLTLTLLDARSGSLEKVVDAENGEPRGVAVDEHENVYLCYETGEISVRSKDLKEEKFLADRIEGVKETCAMVYNSRKSEILLSSSFKDPNYTNFLHRYTLV